MNQVLCGARTQTPIFLSPVSATIQVGAKHTLRPTQDPLPKDLKGAVFPPNSSFAFLLPVLSKLNGQK